MLKWDDSGTHIVPLTLTLTFPLRFCHFWILQRTHSDSDFTLSDPAINTVFTTDSNILHECMTLTSSLKHDVILCH